jgi:DNA-directed RNA polymerase sigma subunit (sigma70/sigma32)
MFDQLSVGDLVSMASAQPVLAADAEARLIHRIQGGDAPAVEELVRGNLRIAIDEAIRVRGLGMPQRELVRAGIRALVEAAQSYDPAEHGPFSSHARLNVRQVMIRSIGVS